MVVDINATLFNATFINNTLTNTSISAILEPLIEGMGYLISTISVIVGGIFGLYLILVFMRWREARQVRKLLTEIRDDLKSLNQTIRYMKRK